MGRGLHAHGRQRDAKLGADGDLGHGGVSQSEEVGHLQLGIRQRDCFVKELDGSLQVPPLHL